jgi:hypothetical protein
MPILGITASSISASVTGGSYESISTVTVGATSVTNVEFTSIPATYTHLQVRGIARHSANETDIKVQLNSDTGSNYSQHRLYGTGSVTGASGDANGTSMEFCGRMDATANTFGANVIDILDYTNTNKYKTVRILMGYDANGSGYVSLSSGGWRNTNAVTSVKLIPYSGNFVQYTQFALYGIKGA